VGNGESDDTDAVAAAFQAAGPGGQVYFPAGGVFAVSRLPDPLPGMALLGGATILQRHGNGRLLRIQDTNNVVVEGLSLDGNDSEGDLLYVGGSSTSTTISRVTATNAGGSGSAGIKIDGALDTRMNDVNVERCYWGIVLAGSCKNVDLSRFSIKKCLSSGVSEGALYLAAVTGAQISNGSIVENQGTGVYAPGSSGDLTFVEVRSSGNGADRGGDTHYRGFAFTETCSNVRLMGCHAESNRECGFYAWTETSNFSVVGCTASNNNVGLHAGGHGFELNGQQVSIVGCQASGANGNETGEGSGFATGGVGVTYSGCVSWDNSWCGFRSASGRNISYSSCTAKNNSRAGAGIADGFKFDVSASNIVLTGCLAYDDQPVKTQGYGIRVSGTVDNYVIMGNVLRGNLSGAIIDDGGPGKSVENNLA
jgi:parallel beta-helix repeat protein